LKKRAFFAPRFKPFHVRIDHNGSRASQPMARGKLGSSLHFRR
jgi:hypothetical protein